MTRSAEPDLSDLRLTVAGFTEAQVASEGELRSALERLSALATGQSMVLARSPQDYIRAVRHGDFWSVTTRNGGILSVGSFTASGTTDYSDKTTRESRAAGSLRKRLKQWAVSPYPERALSTAQVQTLFVEYLLERKFSIPLSGA